MAELKRLFQLADEFGITTGQAMDLCDEIGIAADSGTTLLTTSDADALRIAAHQAGLGDRAVGRAATAPAAGPDAPVAPPPGWVRMVDETEPVAAAPVDPPPVEEGKRSRWRRGARKDGATGPPG